MKNTSHFSGFASYTGCSTGLPGPGMSPGCLGAPWNFTVRAFLQADSPSFPMTFQAHCHDLRLASAGVFENLSWPGSGEIELFDSITTGNVAYELCRPCAIYNMWYVRSARPSVSKAVLRYMPILIAGPSPSRSLRPHAAINPGSGFYRTFHGSGAVHRHCA